MKNFFIINFLYCLLYAQNSGDETVRSGVDAFFNYEYEKSLNILNDARLNYPSHPVVHVAWAAAKWKYDQSQLIADSVYYNLNINLDLVEEVYDSLIIAHPNNPEYLLYLGTSKALRARVYLGQKKMLSTLFSAYTGLRVIQKAKRNSLDVKDIYLPIGAVEWYAGLSSQFVRIGVQILNLKPSRSDGILNMEIAAKESSWAWVEAMSILSVVYQFFDINNERGLIVSKTISEKYPKNYDYKLYYASSLLRNGRVKKSKQLLDELSADLFEQRLGHQKRYKPYLDYLWGYYFYLNKNNIRALEFLKISINDYSSDLDIILASAYLLEGNIYDLLNQPEKAKSSYENCINLENHTNAIKLAKLYLDEPFNW